MLEYVADYVRKDFVKCYCPATVHFSQFHDHDLDSPPRVIIEASSNMPDAFKPPLAQQNAGVMPQTIANWQPGINPRPIYRRIVAGTARIWAAGSPCTDPADQRQADQDALDALVNMTICSLRRSAVGVFEPVRGKQLAGKNVAQHGYCYILDFVIEIPVIDIRRFPPGVLDQDSRTYPEREIEKIDVNAELENVDGSSVSVQTFEIGKETEED